MTGAMGLNTFGLGGGIGSLMLTFVLATFLASIGYRISVRHQMVHGVTPWRIPSVVWAILCGVFTFFGLILELVAEYTTRPETRPSPMPGGAQQAPAQFAYRSSAPAGTDADTLPPIGSRRVRGSSRRRSRPRPTTGRVTRRCSAGIPTSPAGTSCATGTAGAGPSTSPTRARGRPTPCNPVAGG